MSEIKTQKNIDEQIADLLKGQPQNFDVIFSVGPEKIQVKGVKIILKAASPVFEKEFVEKWETAVTKEGEGIPLPDVDPVVFELFVSLIISDTWEVDHLRSINLSHNTMLTLLGLCRRYEILKAVENLEDTATEFIAEFLNYKDSEEFLGLSQENLETAFSCQEFPFEEIDIFECACRWAENQCEQKKIEPTGENFREVLGSSFLEIRFPNMNCKDFTAVSRFKKNLFSLEEKVSIYDFIGMKEDQKSSYDFTHLPFKRIPRINYKPQLFLGLPKQKFANSTFLCDGHEQRSNMFQVNRKILLYGVSFLGPIGGGAHLAHYGATVSVRQRKDSHVYDIGTFKRKIFTRKGMPILFLFDKAITIELSTTCDSSWSNFYFFCYSLKGNMFHIEQAIKGTENVPQYNVESPQDMKLEMSCVEFYLNENWNTDNPVEGLLWARI